MVLMSMSDYDVIGWYSVYINTRCQVVFGNKWIHQDMISIQGKVETRMTVISNFQFCAVFGLNIKDKINMVILERQWRFRISNGGAICQI